MWELIHALRALRDPATNAIHLPWIEPLRGRLRELDLGLALALSPARGYMPDFMTPPPESPLTELGEELAKIRRTPAEHVREDVRKLYGRRRPPALVRELVDQPGRALGRLTRSLERFWELALEPHWPRLRALLEADVAYRARRLTEGGPSRLFADLHPRVAWRGDRLEVDQAYDVEVPLAGRGLLLLPSIFAWTGPGSVTDEPWQPALVYPARALGTIWDPGRAQAPGALARVLGRTRAALLVALDAPRSTTDVARALGLTPGGASQHLTALRDSGLVSAQREGRSVLYVRTTTAEALVQAAGDGRPG